MSTVTSEEVKIKISSINQNGFLANTLRHKSLFHNLLIYLFDTKLFGISITLVD